MSQPPTTSNPGSAVTSVPVHLLRMHLKADAPQRERALVGALLPITLLALVGACLQGPFVGAVMVVPQLVLLVPLAVWYGAVLLLVKRGRYAAWITWINIVIEATLPVPVLLLQAHERGAIYALTASIHMAWGVLIALSGMRMRPALCLLSGALAAAAYAVMYGLFLAPQMGPPPYLTLSWVGVAMRIFYLLAAGVVAAVLAHQLVKKAEAALAQVRAQDLMGKYFLQSQLGQGGMAEVWKATYSPEGGFQKTVAVKRVLESLSQDARFTELFRQEARLCSLLSHPNIVQVLDVGKFDDRYIMALEFVDGITLHALVAAREKLPFESVAFLAHQLGQALQYLHHRVDPQGDSLCIIHSDVNPPNILVSRVGEVKLADFGVARAAQHAAEGDPGIIRGKKGYLAPEQVLRLPLDGGVDLFSLGLTLHAVLTGRHALRGDSQDIMRRLIQEPLPPPSRWRTDTPRELEIIVMHLLERDRAMRTASGAQLCAELEKLPPGLAPSMEGQRALAQAVRRVMARPGEQASVPSDSREVLEDARTEQLQRAHFQDAPTDVSQEAPLDESTRRDPAPKP